MQKIQGKTIIWSDQHFGIKGNSPSRQKICIEVVKKLLEFAKSEGVSNIISAGDWFHSRSQVDVSTINVAYKCLKALAGRCRCIMLLGNHDLYNKNTVDVSSVNMFQDISNVEIVSRPVQVDLNGRKCLLAPWLSDLSPFSPESFDFLIGHFDISSKYLMNSYIEDNMNKAEAKSETLGEIDGLPERKSSAFLGNFIDLAVKGGTVFAGHIHKHEEQTVRGRRFMFIGSPYQQTLADVGNECGFYVVDERGGYSFHRITGVPYHLVLKISDIMDAGPDKFDFSRVRGNIVQRLYDVEISPEDDRQIQRRITDACPFEEAVSDYRVKLDFSAGCGGGENPIDVIRKSKLEYIRKYIDGMDAETLSAAGVESGKLYELMKKYYEAVED